MKYLVYKWAGSRAQGGHYLVILASVPGSHQYMLWKNGAAIAAAGRRQLGQPIPGDAFQLVLAWPARQGCRIRLKAEVRARKPHASLLARATPRGISVMRGIVDLVWVIIVGVATILLYFLLAPAVLILNAVRSLIALMTGLAWKFRSGLSYPGGELEVMWTDDPDTRGALSLLLLPRAIIFLLGTFGLATALARMQGLGQPIISAVAERPDLLKSLDAPLIIAVDLLGTDGLLRGFAVIGSIGLLFLSLPTHRELEQARLTWWSRQLYSKVSPRRLINGAAVVAKLADGLDDFIGWTASPVYVTIHLIPVLIGLIFAEGMTRLIP